MGANGSQGLLLSGGLVIWGLLKHPHPPAGLQNTASCTPACYPGYPGRLQSSPTGLAAPSDLEGTLCDVPSSEVPQERAVRGTDESPGVWPAIWSGLYHSPGSHSG